MQASTNTGHLYCSGMRWMIRPANAATPTPARLAELAEPPAVFGESAAEGGSGPLPKIPSLPRRPERAPRELDFPLVPALRRASPALVVRPSAGSTTTRFPWRGWCSSVRSRASTWSAWRRAPAQRWVAQPPGRRRPDLRQDRCPHRADRRRGPVEARLRVQGEGHLRDPVEGHLRDPVEGHLRDPVEGHLRDPVEAPRQLQGDRHPSRGVRHRLQGDHHRRPGSRHRSCRRHPCRFHRHMRAGRLRNRAGRAGAPGHARGARGNGQNRQQEEGRAERG